MTTAKRVGLFRWLVCVTSFRDGYAWQVRRYVFALTRKEALERRIKQARHMERVEKEIGNEEMAKFYMGEIRGLEEAREIGKEAK